MQAYLEKHSMPKTENIKFVSEKNIFTFGRNNGRTYQWVFENDIPYVVWILKSSEENRKYFRKAYTYFKDKIESEPSP